MTVLLLDPLAPLATLLELTPSERPLEDLIVMRPHTIPLVFFGDRKQKTKRKRRRKRRRLSSQLSCERGGVPYVEVVGSLVRCAF